MISVFLDNIYFKVCEVRNIDYLLKILYNISYYSEFKVVAYII